MTNYATLFGFGLFDPSMKKYRGYLDRFLAFTKKKKIDVVVLCGGHTNLKFPEKSEAGTMAEYLKPLLGDNVQVKIEDRSRTTGENILFAKDYIDLSPNNKIFVVTDSVRFFKVYWMVLHYWFGLSKEEISSEWLKIVKKIYNNPKRKHIALQLNDIKNNLAFRNVTIVIDTREHRTYKDAVHQLFSGIIEVEALYNQSIMNDFMEISKVKEEARAKFGLS
ncbi:MAG: YdcF family protein [Candidatus Micrarchaeota archaeon]